MVLITTNFKNGIRSLIKKNIVVLNFKHYNHPLHKTWKFVFLKNHSVEKWNLSVGKGAILFVYRLY